jgi:chemotaxis protein methyltransferase WspC
MTLPPALRERLCAACGLDPAVLGEAALRSAWSRRLAAANLPSPGAFELLLENSPGDFDALVEEVLVSESWFFRDHAPFAFLEKWAREQWLPAAAGRALRVLSVPCAAGQEPWSIAMTLRDAGLRDGEWVVCAGDLSQRALDHARAAVYPDSAFRGSDAAGREHHFEAAGPRLRRVREDLRGAVRWFRCNLLDPDFFRHEEPFEIVFCRNALIYFDAAARRRAIANLRRCLASGGLLFAGHADGAALIEAGFTTFGPPGAFVFRISSP